MIDLGLLASLVVMFTIPWVFYLPWPPAAVPGGLLDTSVGPLVVGLFVGRLSALALDDPSAVVRVSDVLIIRSGVEFWPGFVAGFAWLAHRARREGVSVGVRAAALAPGGLIMWGSYEATCVMRDGCPGPVSQFGLHPDGLATRMFPVGLVVAGLAIGSAFLLDRKHRRGSPSRRIAVTAIVVAAGVRSVASIWLPRIGEGLTRQHQMSIAVFVVSVSWLVWLSIVPVSPGRSARTPAAR